MFFSVYTLGCKLNQLETEAISDSFRREGFALIPFDQIGKIDQIKQRITEPGIIMINTCTVTSMAEQKARRVIRKALKEHENACVIVTGCYAQMEKAALDALEVTPELQVRLFVIPEDLKDRLLDLGRYITYHIANEAVTEEIDARNLPCLIASWLGGINNGNANGGNNEEPDGLFRFAPESFSSHSRCFIKIQDGCDRSCAYCRVSMARGKSRSLASNEILKRLEALEQRGYSEAVLTGVSISQYNDSGRGLPGLLELLLKGTEAIRIRLSSIEPDMITNELIRVLENSRIRPHFHLSLQSGCEETLARMGRAYAPSDVAKKAAMLRIARNDPFLACDIIAGFPGETDDEFNKTIAFCERLDFAWIHAFHFSPRPGTAAFDFPGKVNEKKKAERVELLNKLAARGRHEYISRWVEKEAEAVVEKREGLPKGLTAGVTENYLKVCISCKDDPLPSAGSLVRCRIKSAHANPRFDAMAEEI